MPSATRTISISHLGRVEGHGGIFVKVVGGEVSEVNLDIFEGSRYYEVLLKGKHFLEVQGIITRVCAICSSTHTVAALSALEDALGVTVSEQVNDLRGLLVLGSTIESHALHVFALALPDFLGFDSVSSMAGKHPAEVAFALRLKQLGNRIQELIGGRAIHPINLILGGFGRLPERDQLARVRDDLLAQLDPLDGAVELFASVPVPSWVERPLVHAALRPYEDAYRFRGQSLCTSRGEEHPVREYRTVVREFAVDHSHAKHAALAGGEAYVVGALPRLKLWGHLLEGRARAALSQLFPAGVPDNMLWNNRAQLVETIHCVEQGARLCDELVRHPDRRPEPIAITVRPGRGVGAIEAPRGTLFHEYEIDKDGRIVFANVITPTAQNLASVERDLRQAAERLVASGDAAPQLKVGLEMVARAYDPCISCSVHVTHLGAPA